MHKLRNAALAVALLGALASNPFQAQADASGPTVVAIDEAGDWGGGGDNSVVGHALGQDLTSAAIEVKDDTVDFVIGVTFLPSAGGVPEASRYTWNFTVDPTPEDVGGDEGVNADLKPFEVDGKFTNYSRGACDPTAGSCPPPRDPGQQPFAIRGDCTVTGSVTTCREIGLVNAIFNSATRTITVPVPKSLLGLTPCADLGPGTNLFGGSVSAAPSAFFTSSAAPLDFMTMDGSVRLPSADPASPCPAIPEPPTEEI